MSDRSRRTKSPRPGGGRSFFGIALTRDSEPMLVTATDVCLWVTLVAVAIGFGGRMASGQLALVVGASATAFCWMLYQLTTREARYSWTGSEWLWAAGILVGLAQIVPLPTGLLLSISPQIKEILPLCFDEQLSDVFPTQWNQLSLAPWETQSGLATFVSYALLFVVAVQRIRTVKDVEQTLCGVSLASIAMMLFAQLQFVTSNGQFFWVYEYPYMDTNSYPLGCFTNRNHLAQFLALGTAPLIWWLLRRLQQQLQDRAAGRGIPKSMQAIVVSLLLLSLGGIGLTALLTLSRGGLMAMAVTTSISVILMCRIGLASVRFGLAMLLVVGVTVGVFSSTKYESLLANRLEQNSGRSVIWQANIGVARDFPILGTGIGTHADAYQLRIDSRGDDGLEYSHAESGYLQVASESGLAGLFVAGAMIATSLWWCLGAFWHSDTRVTSAAAAILASLIANSLHAIGDFFWYTPACMILLGYQLACAARLYRLTRQERGRIAFSFSLPRVVTAGAMCALTFVAAWMFDVKWPAALAEPHRIQAVLLSQLDERDLSDKEKAEANQQRIKETLLAAKLNPRDSKLQEGATTAYVQLFNLKQEHAENTMSANMLRDTVKSSKFESVTAANQWLDRAVGANLKLLRVGLRTVKRSLANSPLRAQSYILLTELSFLDRMDDARFQQHCLVQSLKLRPNDADTLYLVGRSEMLDGDLKKALIYWQPAFDRSPQIQARIAEVLAGDMSPDFFQEEFHPDWKALETIGKAFAKVGRDDEKRQIQRLSIQRGLTEAKSLKSNDELELALISIRNTCRDLGDVSAAAEVLTYAVKRLPHSYSIRYMLSLDLMESDRTADAAEHLRWCFNRRPNDPNLQKVAAKAVAEDLKRTPQTVRRDGEIKPSSMQR